MNKCLHPPRNLESWIGSLPRTALDTALEFRHIADAPELGTTLLINAPDALRVSRSMYGAAVMQVVVLLARYHKLRPGNLVHVGLHRLQLESLDTVPEVLLDIARDAKVCDDRLEGDRAVVVVTTYTGDAYLCVHALHIPAQLDMGEVTVLGKAMRNGVFARIV